MHPKMQEAWGRGWGSATQANRARGDATRQRVLALTFGGATSRQVAEACGLQLSTVRRLKVELRREGLLGCCMQPCSQAPDGDPTRCKWYVS